MNRSSMLIPPLPVIGGGFPTLKPVAQTMTSKSTLFPFSSSIPEGLMATMLLRMKSTLSSTRASRYPGPGVMRLQPTPKDGTRASAISGFLARRVCIMSVKCNTASCCNSDPLMETAWIVLPEVSIVLRNFKYASGLFANSSRCSGVTAKISVEVRKRGQKKRKR